MRQAFAQEGHWKPVGVQALALSARRPNINQAAVLAALVAKAAIPAAPSRISAHEIDGRVPSRDP